MRVARRIFFLLITAYFLSSPIGESSSAATSTSLKAQWWASASGRDRELAVTAAIDGIRGAWYGAYWTSRGDVDHVLYKEFEAGKLSREIFSSLSEKILAENEHLPPAFQKPTSAYVKAISQTYAIYEGAKDKSIVLLLEYCLSDFPIESCEKTIKRHYRD